MLKLSMTYEIITEKSAENGDVEESGFVFEDVEYTATDLLHEISHNEFTSPSDCRGTPRWLTYYGEMDYITGEYENRSIHPGQDKQSQKVWTKVIQIAKNKGYL